MVFYTVKIQNPVLKYPAFIKTSKIFKTKNVFCFQKFSKNSFEILLIFRHLFYQSELIFGYIFYKPSIKIPDLRQNVQNTYFFKKCFVLKYGLVSPIYIYKYCNIIFSHNKENFKTIYVFACILALITNLFKPWELGQYFKNSKKSFCLLNYEFIHKTYSWH